MDVPSFPTELSDVEIRRLVEAVLAGDGAAFDPLVIAHQRLVWHVICRYFISNSEAEDLAQQCFLEAYVNLDRWDNRRSFASWLAGIARNQCLMAARSRSTAVKHLSVYRHHLERQLEEAEHEADDPRLRALQYCQESVEGDAAELLELRYGQGLDFGEIATIIGRTAEATRRLASRLRQKLRLCVEGRLGRSWHE